MKRLLLFLLLSPLLAGAQQVNQDIFPASPGLKLGHSNQRWDSFLRNLDVSGTCFINGVSCITGGVRHVPFAQLGAETDGSLVFCTDCQQTNPCVAGGAGAWGFGISSVWNCSLSGGGGNNLAVNGTPLVTTDTADFNNTTPAAGANGLNVTFQTSHAGTTDSISAEIVGDGNAAHFLNGTGAWAAAGTGNTTSTALTTNRLPKANGANSIVDSSISDDGTTVTTNDTGGITAPSFQTPTTAVAGFFGVGQGTAYSIQTNIVGITAPASVTGYNLILPGAAATGFLHCVNAANIDTCSLAALGSGDIPNNAANTSGTAANLSGTPALPNGTTATTQTTGDNSTKVATTAFVANDITSITGSVGISAASYGAVGEGHFRYDCNWTNGSQIVTCVGSHFMTDATLGQLVFGTNLTIYGFSYSFALQLPQGTITSIDSDTQIHVSTLASSITTSTTNLGFLVWGTDETTQLGNAKAAANATCGTLILPAYNPEQSGAGVVLVSSSAAWPPTGVNDCLGTGSARSGIGVTGSGINASFIMPTANFDFTSCTHGVSTKACFGGDYNGFNGSNFSFFGAGNDTPGASAVSKIGFEIDSRDNSSMHNMDFLFWGAFQNQSLLYGLALYGGVINISLVDVDGFGSTGCVVNYNNLGLGGVIANNLSCSDNYFNALEVLGNSSTRLVCVDCVFGHNAQGSVSVNGTTPLMLCTNCLFVGALTNTINGAALAIGLNVDQAGTGSTLSGTVGLVNSNLSSNSKYSLVQLFSATSTLSLATTTLTELNTTAISTLNNAGLVYDNCGNVNTKSSGGTYYAGAGTLAGNCSATGVVITAAKLVLGADWGNTPAAAWTGLAGYTNVVTGTITNGTAALSTTPTITYTFPNVGLGAPPQYCLATQVGGTNPLGTFTTSSLTGTGVVFTYSLTPTASATEIVRIECVN